MNVLSSLGFCALANEDVGQVVDETLPSPPRFRRPRMMANSQLALSSDCHTQMLIYRRHHFNMHLTHISLVRQSNCQERKWAPTVHHPGPGPGALLGVCIPGSKGPGEQREHWVSSPEEGKAACRMGRSAAEVGGTEGWKHLERCSLEICLVTDMEDMGTRGATRKVT